MTKQEILNIIIERVFEAVDTEGMTQEIKLHLGKPYSVSNSSSSLMWRCPFQIIGIGSETIREGQGIDSIDALLTSLQTAEADLKSYAKRFQKIITWLNEEDLGLIREPVSNNEDLTERLIEPFKTLLDEFFQDKNPTSKNL